MRILQDIVDECTATEHPLCPYQDLFRKAEHCGYSIWVVPKWNNWCVNPKFGNVCCGSGCCGVNVGAIIGIIIGLFVIILASCYCCKCCVWNESLHRNSKKNNDALGENAEINSNGANANQKNDQSTSEVPTDHAAMQSINDPCHRMEQLEKLKIMGSITNEQYESKKEEILSSV